MTILSLWVPAGHAYILNYSLNCTQGNRMLLLAGLSHIHILGVRVWREEHYLHMA